MFHLVRTRITRPYRTSVALEEERVWVRFYHRVDNPGIAAEVIQYLDADADQKRTHPALYLRCKESLLQKKARQARTKRIRTFMRRLLDRLLRKPTSNTRSPVRRGARVIIEGMPESMRESAQQVVKTRPQTAESAAAQSDSGGQPSASRPSTQPVDAGSLSPRNAKAA
jgi:hypothetical protein